MDKRRELIGKSEILKKVSKKLKKEFVGIDVQIDELMSYIEPWYIFNDIQNKPMIVNLFGMTGVGKTSLVQRLFYHLELENDLYRFDIRTLLNEDKISNKMSSLGENNKNKIGIIFDEFQNARTLTENGFEDNKSGLRGLWDLLDSGKIELTSISYVARRIYYSYSALRELLDSGVRIQNGIIQNKIKLARTKLTYSKYREGDKNHIGNYMSDTLYDIKNEFPEFISYENICVLMDEMNTKDVMNFFEDVLARLSKPKIYDFTKSIIFIIGNLDEVYTDHSNFNPDMDADMLNKMSNKITITDVKSALTKRFRSEQIARLGNNYLIYPTLNRKTFIEVINMELKSINRDTQEKYNIKFKFSDNMREILYKESVYPTQGARPVYSRVNSIIRPIISKLLKEIFKKNISFDTIIWDYVDKKHNLKLINGESTLEYTYDFALQVEDQRESKNDDDQCKVAVHESGHAVMSIVRLNLLPKSIYSKTADTSSKGFCLIELPEQRTRKFYDNHIKVLLGGYVAEKMIFGLDELSPGCYGDIEKSTSIASKMVKLYGMYSDPIVMTTHESPNHNLDCIKTNMEETDSIVSKVIMDNLKIVEKDMEKYKILLFNISKYLSENSYMDQKTMRKIISQSNPELLDELKDKDNYYNFKEQFFKFFGDGINSSNKKLNEKI